MFLTSAIHSDAAVEYLSAASCAAGLSGVFTDVESSLRDIKDVLEADEAGEKALQEAGGTAAREVHQAAQTQAQALAEIRRDLEKYMEAHEKASFTNTELHRAMNLHISNLRLLGGPLESLKETLPRPQLNEGERLRCLLGASMLQDCFHDMLSTVLVCRGSRGTAVCEADPRKGAGNEGSERLSGEAAA